MSESFPCPSCGGPNDAIPGASHLACTYCGANLTIPKELRLQATPKPATRIQTPPARPAPSLENEASDLLRKAQPIAIKAWNAYAYWTWLRWLIPTCLTLLVIGLVICAVLGFLPFLLFQ